jgi:CheY-like chemotaxis protein
MTSDGKDDRVNILVVDDQPAKLLSYEVILSDIGENLIKASSGREALEHLLKSNIAVVLMDVCMPELDGFELAAMLREHPRFAKTAIIFISAIHLTDMDCCAATKWVRSTMFRSRSFPRCCARR